MKKEIKMKERYSMKNEKMIFGINKRLVISDVDDTLAYPYMLASDDIIYGLNNLLKRGIGLFFVSGQGIANIRQRIIDRLDPGSRYRILVGTCSGAEVWGFDERGELLPRPFYSKYEEAFNDEMKAKWREAVKEVIEKFQFKIYETMPKPRFREASGCDFKSIMYEDRGPQITFEVVNSCSLNDDQISHYESFLGCTLKSRDLRAAIVEYANKLFEKYSLPVTARLAGNFAVDLAVRGVTKTTAVKFALYSGKCISSLGFTPDELKDPEIIEIWGDKFSAVNGGTDRHICEAVPNEVKSIDFRHEPECELPSEYNINIWDGDTALCEAVEEYMERSGLIEKRESL